MKVTACLLAPALGLALSACSGALASGGPLAAALPINDQALAAAAAARSVRLDVRLKGEFWLARYRADAAAPAGSGSLADLYAVDSGRELALVAPAADPALAKLWARTAAAKAAPAWLAKLEVGPDRGFLPTTVYSWGVFYNAARLAPLASSPPASLADFEALLAKAKAAGLTPIALGAAFGWPGAAWFCALDLRLNGAAALAERYAGKRPWNDAGGLAVAAKLAAWRDAGYFTAAAATTGQSDAQAALDSGAALCLLMGAFAVDRAADPAALRFAAVPQGSAPPAELAGLSGFFLPPAAAGADKTSAKTAARAREAAFDLVDAYIGVSGGADAYRLPLAALAKPAKGRPAPVLNPVQAAEAAILGAAVAVAPSFDRAVAPQFLQDSLPLWARFFAPGGQSAADFVAELERLARLKPAP